MRRALSAVVAVPTMAGCARYGVMWARPGATEADFHAAASSCERQAATRFAPLSLGAPGYFSTNQTHCTPTPAGPNCILIGSGYLPQARAENDVNEVSRDGAFRACMGASGWRAVTAEEGQAMTNRVPRRDTK